MNARVVTLQMWAGELRALQLIPRLHTFACLLIYIFITFNPLLLKETAALEAGLHATLLKSLSSPNATLPGSTLKSLSISEFRVNNSIWF